MKKDFDAWNSDKKKLHRRNAYLPLYRERQVRWCRLGVNVGYEQDGAGTNFSRPVLVLRAFSRHVCLVVPLSTATKANKYHFPVGEIAGRSAIVILSQVRLVDTKRLDQHIATLDTVLFREIRKAVKALL
jgi:mRNA interferase MazF